MVLWAVYCYLEPPLQDGGRWCRKKQKTVEFALGTDHVCSAERLSRETSGKPKEKEMQTTGNVNRWQIRRQEDEDGDLCVMNMNVIKTDISAAQDRAYICVWIAFELHSRMGDL